MVIEMTIGERIKKRRTEIGLSVDELALKIGKNRATIYRYESDDIENLPVSILEPLAKALRTTPAELFGWSSETGEKYPNYSTVDNIIPMPIMKKVPLLGTIACGEPILAEENIEAYINMPEEVSGTFALRCKGDSMINARIFDGDIVFIRQQPDVENGTIAAVLIDNEATLKKVYKYPNRIELRAENPTMRTLEYEGEDMNNVHIIGKAVYFLSPVQ